MRPGQFDRLAGFAFAAGGAQRGLMTGRSPLDDPTTAAFAWKRYRRLMRWMFAVTITVVIVALGLVYREAGMVSIHFFIATALGIGASMLLMSALMGLVFLSSGTGHDESIDDRADGGAGEAWGEGGQKRWGESAGGGDDRASGRSDDQDGTSR